MQKNIYNVVPVEAAKKNAFDLSHQVLGTSNYGQMLPLKPIFCMPGDMMKCSYEALIRTVPLASPAMQRIWCTIHAWYVPHRLVWPDFEKWIDNVKSGGVLPAFPYITLESTKYTANSKFFDGMGLPDPGGTSHNISAIAMAAYQYVYNVRYRDQNLVTTDLWDDQTGLVNGNNSSDTDLFRIRKRAWSHDYFTSNLPTAQKGDPVSLPLGTVEYNPANFSHVTPPRFENFEGTPLSGTPLYQGASTGGAAHAIHEGESTSQSSELGYDPNGTLEAQATTINDLRTAEALQKWLEMMERSGSRYEELLNAAFNVKIRDERISRPEYVGGTMSPVMISEVLQNSESTVDSPLGAQGGHGVAVTSGGYANFHCPEFGYIIPILTIMPEANYYGGIPRHYSMINDPTEFPWPQFAQLGEQPTLNKELDVQHTTPGGTFGYLPRYQEHRSLTNQVMGSFISQYNSWSEVRNLVATEPALNKDFIECTPENQIFAVTDPEVDHFIFNFNHKILAIRALPKFGVPSLK